MMAAAATIPVGPFSFEGTIAEIWYGRRHYRLATYCGARVKERTEKRIVIEQKHIKFEAQLQQNHPQSTNMLHVRSDIGFLWMAIFSLMKYVRRQDLRLISENRQREQMQYKRWTMKIQKGD